jgi:hypothetical protein
MREKLRCRMKGTQVGASQQQQQGHNVHRGLIIVCPRTDVDEKERDSCMRACECVSACVCARMG